MRAATFDLRGWSVAVVGIDEVLDPTYMVAGQDRPGTAAGHDFGLALRAVRQAAARADIVVVMIHWGVELDTQPRAYQVEEAHRMIDAGADVIFGATRTASSPSTPTGAGRSSTAWGTSSGPTCPRRAPRRALPRSG